MRLRLTATGIIPSGTIVDEECVCEGATIAAALKCVADKHPSLKSQLFEVNGELKYFYNIYINGRNIRDIAGMNSLLSQDDEITIISASAGG